MNIDQTHCPFCGANAAFHESSMVDVYVWECLRCGEVRITFELLSFIEKVKSEVGSKLPTVTRMSTDNGSPVTLTTENYQTLANDLPRYTPMEKLDLLLYRLMLKTKQFGRDAEFSPEWDYPLVFCSNFDELRALLAELSKRAYIRLTSDTVTLTMLGWEKASTIGKSGRSSDAAFIAMSFDPLHDATYEKCIAPAVEDAGYRPLRVDKIEHTNRIDDQVVADIRRSRFMVADLTDQRQGVYFEAGMMMGLGRTVIWMVRKDELPKVHFDNRQYNFIVYEDLEDARKRLQLRILALEGEGPVTNKRKTATHS